MKRKIIFFLLLTITSTLFAQEYEWVIEPEYKYTDCFSEGLALVQINDRVGFIDITGKWVIPPKYFSANKFSEGLACVSMSESDNKAGFIDKKGTWVIKPKYRDCYAEFNHGYAEVEIWNNTTELYDNGYIDKAGKFTEADDNITFNLSEGIKRFKSDKKFGFKEFPSGNIVVDAIYKYASLFSNELAKVQLGEKVGFINKNGEFVLSVKFAFDSISSFSDGFACAKQSGLYGYIDKSGNWKIQPQFIEAMNFENGIAAAKTDSLWGYINKTGNWIIEPQFIDANYFSDGIAPVRVKRGAGFIKYLPISARIKNYVENKISEWQKKGEYEKTSEYQKRVNETNRNAKIQQFTNEFVEQLKKKYADNIRWTKMIVNQYDADNETYLISSPQLSDFAIPVPLADAKIFKTNWAKSKFSNVDFYIQDETFHLAKLTVTNPTNGKKYIYDSKQPTIYLANNIQYNFNPIEIKMLQDNAINNTKIQENKTEFGNSDIDLNIPTNEQINDKTFVIIIANENYSNEVKVQYAINDGKIFKGYCEKTLGIPSKNIRYSPDATFGTMKSSIKWISDVTAAFNGQAKIVFYYAGHGMPNEADKSAYLLPVDGFSGDYETAIKLDDLYSKISSNPSQQITVFLDACFSGSVRDNGMLASARGVKIKPNSNTINGNMVVFSAASGEETAFPYKEKQHGLFTYFLLKKLQETKGDVSYQALSNYIIDNVRQQSVVVNQKSQTPQVNTSQEMESIWKTLKLK
jgi:hypothetical protein